MSAAGIDRDTVTTWADGCGNWHARVDFASHGYGNAGQYALDLHWARIRALARRAIVREIASREQKTWETYAMAKRRVSASLGRLIVTASRQDGQSVNRSFTFSERP